MQVRKARELQRQGQARKRADALGQLRASLSKREAAAKRGVDKGSRPPPSLVLSGHAPSLPPY